MPLICGGCWQCEEDRPTTISNIYQRTTFRKLKQIDDVIHRNNQKLLVHVLYVAKQLTYLKYDVGLFSRFYTACQTGDGMQEEFFCHENQASPPSFCNGGKLHLSTKSYPLTSLEEFCLAQTEAPIARSLNVEKGAIVQMLHPKGTRSFSEYA